MNPTVLGVISNSIFLAGSGAWPCGSCGSFCNRCMPLTKNNCAVPSLKLATSSPLKIGQAPKRKGSSFNHPFFRCEKCEFQGGVIVISCLQDAGNDDRPTFFCCSPKKMTPAFQGTSKKNQYPKLKRKKYFPNLQMWIFQGVEGCFFFTIFKRTHDSPWDTISGYHMKY